MDQMTSMTKYRAKMGVKTQKGPKKPAKNPKTPNRPITTPAHANMDNVTAIISTGTGSILRFSGYSSSFYVM